MENGHQGKLVEKLSGLALDESSTSNESLFQVMKAVEAAEVTIKQQVEENNWLRSELQRKAQELERYKSDPTARRSHSFDSKEQVHISNEVQQSVPSIGSQEERIKIMPNTSVVDSTLVLKLDPKVSIENPTVSSQAESHFSSNKINGTVEILPGGHTHLDNSVLLQLSSSSATSFSTSRYQMDGEYDARLNLPGHGLLQMAEVINPSCLGRQEHEEEIIQLRKYLADFSMKEAQIRNEKFVLEKRIAYMQLAFDQQQQDLVDAASKAFSYQQDIIEENVRLTYKLQAAQQERSTFVSSLLPLLADYSLQPPVPDAHSIVSNIRILFRHLQEKLNHTESKLKDFQYQLAPWNPDVNHLHFAPQSPSHPDAALATSNKDGLDLVPRPTYSPAKMPASSTDSQTMADWDLLSHHQSGLAGPAEQDNVGGSSPFASRQFAATRDEVDTARRSEVASNRQVMFRDTISNSDVAEPDIEGNQNERETSATWGSENYPYSAAMNDNSSSYSPYPPPVLEEPSSFSEAADDDPLPAIQGLQISGDAVPGQELQACGYSINGTSSCNFAWVCHLEDGSVYYIDGAKQPKYLVTADDVDTYLAIEVQPLDNRKRKGELVRVFANENRKITCDPEMQKNIQKTLYSGHATYKVSLSTGYLDIWEPATLSIKRGGYSIKCSKPSEILINDKFLPNTGVSISISHGHATEFIIRTSNGTEHLLRVDKSTDTSSSRDTIVLTFRLFMTRAGERKKGKKRFFF